jgi:signal transduction histidine kinase
MNVVLDRGLEAGREGGTVTDEVVRLLEPGILVLAGGEVVSADPRALELLGIAEGNGLTGRWSEVRARLEAAGLRLEAGSPGPSEAVEAAEAEIPAAGSGPRRLAFELRPDGRGGGLLLVRDPAARQALLAELRRAALLRTLSHITPAVAHDLRAPINAMVFNIEVLKETIASGRGSEPGGRDRQLRYVNVLREELSRLHRELEIYIAQISPRGDRDETLDLRELVDELATLLTGPARKQMVKVKPVLPATPVPVTANRFVLRQALLHLAVAALGTVPRDGLLELDVEARGRQSRVRISGMPGEAGGTGPEPAPGFGVEVASEGLRAQLWSARALLAAQGGRVRESGTQGCPCSYEVELGLAQDLEKERE